MGRGQAVSHHQLLFGPRLTGPRPIVPDQDPFWQQVRQALDMTERALVDYWPVVWRRPEMKRLHREDRELLVVVHWPEHQALVDKLGQTWGDELGYMYQRSAAMNTDRQPGVWQLFFTMTNSSSD